MSAISLHTQVQFHTKYPLFDSQSECRFTFSYGILLNIGAHLGSYCTNVPFQKISIPTGTPRKVYGNSKGEGVSKAQSFKGKYEAKLEFPRGGGSS